MSENPEKKKPMGYQMVTEGQYLVGLFIEVGFGLRPLRTLEPEEVQAMVGDCVPTSTGKPAAGDSACSVLYLSKALEHFRFMEQDPGVVYLKKNMARQHMCFFAANIDNNLQAGRYVQDVIARCQVSITTCVAALVYVARVKKKALVLSQRSVHRIFLGSLIVAIKVFEEPTATFSDYAKAMTVHVDRLHNLELGILKIMDYETFISTEEFTVMLFSLRSMHAQYAMAGKSVGKWRQVMLTPTEDAAMEPDDEPETTLVPDTEDATECAKCLEHHSQQTNGITPLSESRAHYYCFSADVSSQSGIYKQ